MVQSRVQYGPQWEHTAANISAGAGDLASQSFNMFAVAVTPAARPCRWEFRLDLFLPAAERGPVLRRALRRLAAICRSVGIVQAAADGDFFQASLSGRTSPSMTRSTAACNCRPNPLRKSAIQRNALSRRHSRDLNSRSNFSRWGGNSHCLRFDCIFIKLALSEHFQNQFLGVFVDKPAVREPIHLV